MAPSELDSFYFKFKNLLFAEKNASLTIKSEAGRAQATLCVDLGHVLPEPGPHLPHGDARNNTSRSRRRERRAEARLLAAEEAGTVDKSTATDKAEVAISGENTFEEEDGDTTENVAPRKVDSKAVERLAAKAEETDAKSDKSAENSLDQIDATEKVDASMQVEKTVETPFEVVDEVCNDETYENNQDKSEGDTIEKNNELLDAIFKEGKVVTNAEEVILEVRPQYCKFSAKDLASRLKQMGLELVCLPWVANTGRYFYTARIKITKRSYEAFKTRGECGAIPKGFYRVETSWKYN